MESKALMEYGVPAYPKKEQVQLQPSLLRKSVYKRWQKLYDIGISGMLVAGLSLSGCDKKPGTNTTTTQGIEESPNQNPNASQTNNISPAKLVAIVAPVFEHGEGRGAVGCVAVSPPAFLSEDEALVVIREEFAKYSINFNKEKVILNEINIAPGTFENAEQYNFKAEEPVPLEIDLQDLDKEINIEYVSNSDYFKLGGERSMSTAYSMDMKKVAKQVRNQMQSDATKGIYGVFYDPLIKSKYMEIISEELTMEEYAIYVKKITSKEISDEEKRPYEERLDQIKQKCLEPAKEQLREQVQDFVQWLKEQGVI